MYEFDNMGRTVCVRNADGSFSQVGYDEDKEGTENRITHASSGEQYVNNLLNDSSAENSTLGWTAFDNDAVLSVDTNEHFLGKNSLKIEKTVSNTSRPGYYQNINVSEKTEYTLSAYVKTDSVEERSSGNGAGLYVKFYDSTNTEIANSVQYSYGITGTNDWQRTKLTFTTPEGTKFVRVFVSIFSAKGTAYFDCMQLEKGNAVNDYNMLQNSSFSTSSNWTTSKLATGDGINTSTGKLKISGSATQNRSVSQTVQINRAHTGFTISAVSTGNSVPLSSDDRAYGVKLEVHYSDNSTDEKIASFNTATSAEQKTSATYVIPQEKQDLTITYVV